MMKIAALVVRGLLVIFGAVVLGLSVTLAKNQAIGNVPSETAFSSFCGAFGLLVSAVGILAVFIDKVPPFVVMAADGLASVFYLAAGIALTLALKPVSSCENNRNLYFNKLLNGGCQHIEGYELPVCPNYGSNDLNDNSKAAGRCHQVQADYVFEYLGFVFGLGVIAVTFFMSKGRGGSSAAYV
ncbi:marvel domain-containing protein [Xylariomycetidae sp. FL2044]|nr:marvel domain-containing protein [Xylariomycetidae sp. FL2044]